MIKKVFRPNLISGNVTLFIIASIVIVLIIILTVIFVIKEVKNENK